MTRWSDDPGNATLIRRLRQALDGDGRVMIFLGAGLSFGAARLNSRASFDYDRYDYRWPFDFPHEGIAPGDDGLPLPTWPWLVNRMFRELAGLTSSSAEQESLKSFFIEEGPLDCAQLFRQTVGEPNYREFLVAQFDAASQSFIATTPSHHAVVALDLPLIFTTNYDELIETAHHEAGKPLRTSISEKQFIARRAERPPRHLVKLHGSIDQPETIVLTRTDYARARTDRKEMLDHLRGQLAEASFLFIGFSLSDPNFNLLHDDIRTVYGMNVPSAYTVQGRRDLVKDTYLRSLGVNTVWLDSWNNLPDFLTKINPQAVPAL